MIVSSSMRVILLEVPKTGSMALSDTIIGSALFDPTRDFKYGQHTTVTEALDNDIITEDFLATCTVYAFIRNPYERILSAWYHDFKVNVTGMELPIDKLISLFRVSIVSDDRFIKSDILRRPQFEMLEGVSGVKLLKFEQYVESIRSIYLAAGLSIPMIVSKNVRRGESSPITVPAFFDEETRRYVKHKYSKDFELWESLDNRTGVQ